jgi:hypothetical protein
MANADGNGTPEDFLDTASGHWPARPDPWTITCFLLQSRPRYWLCWFITLCIASGSLYTAWTCWNDRERGDGNWGHAAIDFGGQWLLGRMIVEGRGRHLYDREHHQVVLQAGYPEADEKPNAPKHDYEALLDWTMASEDPAQPNLGGPMYPPIHALFYTPLGLLSPHTGYRVVQLLTLAAVFLCGWLVERLSVGRIWWPVATAALIGFPGFAGAINLGQNAVFTLALLLAGWWQLKEGHPWRGGLAWGFLAYKPVWAVAFILAPLLLRRWRFLAAMLVTGALLVAITLPVVGVSTWFDWLAVGRIGAFEYTRQGPWINLSRDLLSIPRRWLLHFEGGIATNPERPLPNILGTTLWLALPIVTILLVLWRGPVRRLVGAGAAFVLLGAYFACYHFMYYDVMLAALPVAVLFVPPAQFLPLRRWQGPLPPSSADAPAMASASGAQPLLFVLMRGQWRTALTLRPHWWRTLPALMLFIMLLVSPALFNLWKSESPSLPWDTIFLFGLWLWSGWALWSAYDEAPGTAVDADKTALAQLPSGVEVGQLG